MTYPPDHFVRVRMMLDVMATADRMPLSPRRISNGAVSMSSFGSDDSRYLQFMYVSLADTK